MQKRTAQTSLSHITKAFVFTFFLFCFTPFLTSNAQDAPDDGIPVDEAIISKGEALFKGNCTSCHKVHQKVIGPALANVYERNSLPWIYAFVKNSQKVIKSGDPYAVKLYKEYANTEMTAFAFEDEEILSIMAYVKNETLAGPPVAAVVEVADGGQGGGGDQVASSYMTAVLVGLVVVLLLILVVLALIVSILVKYLNQNESLDEDDQEVVNQRFDLGSVLKSRAFLGFVIFLFMALGAKSVIDGLYTVGVQQGYAPKQPIAFSHKIHAGQYEIDCNYCHTGVRKSKNANIPSPNICMNCHSSIKTESPEIKKIYAAIEDNKPIEWVRIHNLPDLAYFNHQQHVAVGEIECQTCHGEIQEMEVVAQHAPLTMGWCISCHRETDVNTKGNAYYDNLVQLHDAEGKGALKVEDIGGLECSRCHY